MSKPDITGTLVMEKRTKLPDGRYAIMVFGLLAMPEDQADDYCHSRPTQLVFEGSGSAGLLRLSHAMGMTLEAGSPTEDEMDREDRDKMLRYYKCCTVDQLITSPIWRL